MDFGANSLNAQVSKFSVKPGAFCLSSPLFLKEKMSIELQPFKLPKKWGSETDEDQNSPRLYLKNSINLDLPISGGWGYSIEDCVVINKDALPSNRSVPLDVTSIEYTFVEKRIYAELIVFRNPIERFSGIEWDLTSQQVQEHDQKTFDVLNFKVVAFSDKDWDFLKADWQRNDSFEGNEDGKKLHEEERQKRMCFYQTQYWFDITSFYNN